MSVEAKILEAPGPRVLVVMPNWQSARIMASNLRHQYKDQATGSMECLHIEGGKEIHFVSARTQAMRGVRVDDLIIHPHVYDLPDISDILDAFLPCVVQGGRKHIEWPYPEDEDYERDDYEDTGTDAYID